MAFGGLLLLGGRLADRLRRRTTLLVGIAGFAVASAVGGAAPSAGWLIGARTAQGVFAALPAPSTMSLLTLTFTDPRERGKAFGIFGAIMMSGSAPALTVCGALTQFLGWRWSLYVNVPVAVLAGPGAWFAVPPTAVRSGHSGIFPASAGFPRAVAVPARLVRALAGPAPEPAAAARGGARPRSRRRLPDDRGGLVRRVRDVPVPDLPAAGRAGLRRARRGAGVPADTGGEHADVDPAFGTAAPARRPAAAAGRAGCPCWLAGSWRPRG
ncbi:MFS transporter [Amycolatopsis sp. FBCC-B4732]|nr:MFS transporter [Amycolatopsis sp. FBCC-B4732]